MSSTAFYFWKPTKPNEIGLQNVAIYVIFVTHIVSKCHPIKELFSIYSGRSYSI